MATIAQHIVKRMREIGTPNVVFMNEDNNKGSEQRNDLPGCITTRRNKVDMITILIEDYMKKNRIVFNRNFIVTHEEYLQIGDVKSEIVKQFRNFCQKLKETKARDGTTFHEKFYTGMDGIVALFNSLYKGRLEAVMMIMSLPLDSVFIGVLCFSQTESIKCIGNVAVDDK